MLYANRAKMPFENIKNQLRVVIMYYPCLEDNCGWKSFPQNLLASKTFILNLDWLVKISVFEL